MSPRARVDPHLIFGISLFVALAVTGPMLAGTMQGRVDIVTAGVHLLVAIALSWAGCYGVGSLLYGYAHSATATPTAAPTTPTITGLGPLQVTSADVPQRRASDAAPDVLTTPSNSPQSMALDAGAVDAA